MTNRNGDDAHQSHLVITLPDAVRYSSIVHSGAAVGTGNSKLLDRISSNRGRHRLWMDGSTFYVKDKKSKADENFPLFVHVYVPV